MAKLLLFTLFFAFFSGTGAEPNKKHYVFTQTPQAVGLIVRFKTGSTLALASAFSGQVAKKNQDKISQVAAVPLFYERHLSNQVVVLRAASTEAMSTADWRAAAERLKHDSSIENAEPDWVMRLALVPTDSRYANKWNYFSPTEVYLGKKTIGGANLPTAWDITLGSATVTVAVIDTGITNHTDLNANVVQGYDFISTNVLTGAPYSVPANFVANDGNGRDNDPSDPGDWITGSESQLYRCTQESSSWHGTHVAGTIAAVINNGGSVGAAPGVRILPVRALGKCGGATSDVIDAIRWSAGLAVAGVPANLNPADVLNLSLGAAVTCSVEMQNAINDVTSAGKLIVAAVGNEASTQLLSPANCNGVLAVTAHGVEGANAIYANYSARVNISAPGGGNGTLANGFSYGAGYAIDSTLNSGTQGPIAQTWGSKQGTSMAAPHVAAIAALIKSVRPLATPDQVRNILMTNIRQHPAGTFCGSGGIGVGTCGTGLLDASLALNAAQLTGSDPPNVVLTQNQTVLPGQTVNLDASASSASSGKTITTFVWGQIYGASTITTLNNANTSVANFTAPATGTYAFRVTVTDSAASNSAATTIIRVNTPPTITNSSSGFSVTQGNALNFSVTATDIDGDDLLYVARGVPAGATFSATTGAFSWSAAVVGTYNLSVFVSDGISNSSTQNIVLSINPVTPVISAGGGGGGGSTGLLGLLFLLVALVLSRRYPVFR